MTCYVIGVDSEGRSTLAETRPQAEDMLEMLWKTSRVPCEIQVPVRRDDQDVTDVGVPAGGSAFFNIHWPPAAEFPLHRTDTLDYGVCVTGELTCVLEVGDVVMGPGDTIVIPGVLHGWKAGVTGSDYVVSLVAVDR